jgi:hypothetical protein
MNRNAKDELNLNPKSDKELHSALSRFELKYEARLKNDERIHRF